MFYGSLKIGLLFGEPLRIEALTLLGESVTSVFDTQPTILRVNSARRRSRPASDLGPSAKSARRRSRAVNYFEMGRKLEMFPYLFNHHLRIDKGYLRGALHLARRFKTMIDVII